MIWLLKDFDLLSVLLRAASLAFEALTVGGLLFLFLVALPAGMETAQLVRIRRAVSWAALGMLVAQCCDNGIDSAILVGGSALPFASVMHATFFIAGSIGAAASALLFFLLRSRGRTTLYACIPLGFMVLGASLTVSHAVSRLDHRPLLVLLTGLHHLGTAGWVGAMVFLLAALRESETDGLSTRLARRYSTLAIVSVISLIGAGIGLSYFYIGSWAGVYGTSYGAMVTAKVYLMLTMLLLGAGNYRLLRGDAVISRGLLVNLRRFSEAEIGLGLTAVLAAASLTSQPPAIDLKQDRLSGHEIYARMHWETPRLTSPPITALAVPASMDYAIAAAQYGAGGKSDANDRAWSEYNHHWAGMIVLAAALLAFVHRFTRYKWLRRVASNWPLLFIGLAVFILLRADPENWPLGPRSFWQSFSSPDVLEHRTYALLISCFAIFEWAVENHVLRSKKAAYVFPMICAMGGAVLLTHSHGLGNVKEEMLAELSHTPIAVLGATAGWGRWIELRLPGQRVARIASYIWPVCLMLVGIILLAYRES